MGSSSLWGYWNALIEILSLQSQAGQAPRVPLGLQQEKLHRAMAVAHCVQGAPLSAGHLCAFFLFVFLRCGSGSFPLAAPASSGCVPPAAKGKSRISRAHQTPGSQYCSAHPGDEKSQEPRNPQLKDDSHLHDVQAAWSSTLGLGNFPRMSSASHTGKKF